ncbi:protein-L-isoaspartate(D-aspartate) O-methyltransferase [Halorientalis halophila]|uniref:protein-L-isoaspartate(D-aspartate) O-methyltransferase n=1 Tax=Halorientalis halophila TaxID=3108499 RepID=UPI003008E717
MNWAERRESMVDRLESTGRVDDPATLDAMRAVPRHEFVPEAERDAAYADRPLPIGDGQTISAPHMVAIMTELLDLQAGDDVLEVGTGCGYHAAVTAELVGPEHVYSVEYHDSLAEQARERFERLGYVGISVRVGDGKQGWPDHAPYDRAYLTCAAPDFPQAVVEQVRTGGLLLGPLGRGRQTLVRARKREDGSLDRTDHGGVRFVEMQ